MSAAAGAGNGKCKPLVEIGNGDGNGNGMQTQNCHDLNLNRDLDPAPSPSNKPKMSKADVDNAFTLKLISKQFVVTHNDAFIVSPWMVTPKLVGRIDNELFIKARGKCGFIVNPIHLNSREFEWFVRTLVLSEPARTRFIVISEMYKFMDRIPLPPSLDKYRLKTDNTATIFFVITNPVKHYFDKVGGTLSNTYISFRMELEIGLSWLSTLGGAFSALGDISENWAEEAAKISRRQLTLAMKMGDPLIQSRCRLYYAISLIQRKHLHLAKHLIKQEYRYAISLPDGVDPKLRKMCIGVWSKLQYAWTQKIEVIKRLLMMF